MISGSSMTKSRDKKSAPRDKTPVKKYRKRQPGSTRGRKMSDKSKDEIERIQSVWNTTPDMAMVRLAYVTKCSVNNLRKWVERGHLVKPTVAAPTIEAGIAQAKQVSPVYVPLREDTPVDNVWDVGPVPSIESIRRQIKRNIAALILDAATVQKYSSALAQLHTISEKESAVVEEEAERMLLLLPSEDEKPE
jgi:hypothetical protein